MQNTRKLTPAVIMAALGLLFGISSPAAESSQNESRAKTNNVYRTDQTSPSQKESTTNTNTTSSSRSETIQGTIDAFRHVDLRSRHGERDRHSLVRLKLQDGRRAVVDLGPKKDLDQFNLQRGDFIQIEGRRGSISGDSVFIAKKISLDGRTISITRPAGTQTSDRSGSRTGQYRMSGKIEGFRHVNLRDTFGQRDEHSLVCVKLKDGKSAVVDLGSRKDLEDLDLEKGDQIEIRGRHGTVDGRSVLMADQIQVDERSFDLQQSRPQSAGETFAIRGQVEGYQLATFGSGTNQTALLKLRLMDGRSVLIDAGDNFSQGELDLKNLNLMDRVTIEGTRTNIAGSRVLVANTVRFEEPTTSRRYVREPDDSDSSEQDRGRSQNDTEDDSQQDKKEH